MKICSLYNVWLSLYELCLSPILVKESCLILLQTIPGSIDINSLKSELLSHFPDIVNVHDFHVWQLTANKVISTVHVIFKNPKVSRNSYWFQIVYIIFICSYNVAILFTHDNIQLTSVKLLYILVNSMIQLFLASTV